VEVIKEVGIIILVLRLTKRKQQEIGRRLGTNYRRKINQ
jgi:transcriptional regulator